MERDGEKAEWARGKVMLTVAHLCHDSTCDNEEHLRAMCNRCHLRLDVEQHTRNSAETRDRKKREREDSVGQGRMFEGQQ